MTDSAEPRIDAGELNTGGRLISGLFFWQFKKLLRINLFAVVIVGLYVLLRVMPFTSKEIFLLMGILLHCWLVSAKLWRSSTRQAGFLYSWGFTRDQIWWQTLLASLASGALVCGVAWLLMVLQVRCFVQDQLIANPYFPLSASSEYWIPWVWFYGYIVTLPLMHYGWVRYKQSASGILSGWAIMIFGIVILTWSFFQSSPPIHRITTPVLMLLLLAALFIPATVLLIVAGRRLHGTMETL